MPDEAPDLRCQYLCCVQERQQKEAQQRTDRLLQELHTQQQWDVQGIHSWLRKELQSQVRAMSCICTSASPAAARNCRDRAYALERSVQLLVPCCILPLCILQAHW